MSTGNLSMIFMRKVKPYFLMVCLQIGSAGMYIISMATLNHGMNRYVLSVYHNAIAALVLAPFALLLERPLLLLQDKPWKTRPKMTFSVFLQIMTLGFLEPILDQGFTDFGMKFTSTSFASAIMNAVPSITFVIAVLFRLECVKIKEVRSQAKIIGTLVIFAGALLMTIYKGPIIDLVWSQTPSHQHGSNSGSSHKLWLVGTALILVGCIARSCSHVLRSIMMKKYRAELSLSSLICLFGALQSLNIALIVERHPSVWAVGWDSRLFSPLYTGIVSSGINYVQGLVVKERGCAFVTAFNPLCTVMVVVLGSAILGEQLRLGSIIGGIIIAIGLYSVVWGESKDYPVLPQSPDAQELTIAAAGATNSDQQSTN